MAQHAINRFCKIIVILSEEEYNAVAEITRTTGYMHGDRPSLSGTIKRALHNQYPEVKAAWQQHLDLKLKHIAAQKRIGKKAEDNQQEKMGV